MVSLHMFSPRGWLLRLALPWLGKTRLPKINGRLSISGLGEDVEIIRDRWGVPHIYAGNETDLYFAQGFVHGQDRLWQMELSRRIGAGRLSELFGPSALETDRLARTLGFRRLAEASWAEIEESMRGALEAYAAGVNTQISGPVAKRPIEFSLLRHRPEPWHPLDSLAFGRYLGWALSTGWYSELVRARIADRVGGERAADMEIEYPPGNAITLPEGIEFNLLSEEGVLMSAGGPYMDSTRGSNAWAVSGTRSDTGAPILANDPHLPLRAPSIWYQNHLRGDRLNVTGVSFPGTPGVAIGHNERIAWGATVAFTDCQDLFVEHFNPDDPTQYMADREWLDAEVIDESIAIRGRAVPWVEKVIVTRHGPVIPQAGDGPDERLAISATALAPGSDVQGFLALDRAENWDEFVDATRGIARAQLNLVYADVDGNIGHRVTGSVPVRAKGLGLVPSPGWTGEYDWVGEIPFEEMPYALNPGRGLLVSANNRVAGDEYPHYLGSAWANGYRATRIEAELAALGKVDAADCQRLQMDFTSLPGRRFVKLLEGLGPGDADARHVLRLLRGWDGQLDSASAGGAVYEVVRYTTLSNLLEPTLGRELTLKVMGRGLSPLIASESEYVGHDTVILLRLLERPESSSSWWIEQVGGRRVLLERSLKEAAGWLRDRLGDDPSRWRWGDLHGARFSHAMGLGPPLDRVFNRGPYPVGGDADTPCQFAFAPGVPFAASSSAPSYRQIIDLGDLSRSVAVMAPGQSGQIGSKHYDDLIAPWLRGNYHPMLWTREQVEAEAEARLILEPVAEA